MTSLIWNLKKAHAIEIGAFHAYHGHWNSLVEKQPLVATRIQSIQMDELDHRENVYHMLKDLGHQPSPILDAVLYVIGKTISAGCYVIGPRMAAWGAKVMEIMGSKIYRDLAKIARDEGHPALGVEFDYMARTEEAHEDFFRRLK